MSKSVCRRCQQPTSKPVEWHGVYGADRGVYCGLCWEICMSMWVMTQNDRAGCLALVDDAIRQVRKVVKYALP